ncbi:hypothetical protein E8E14_010894 [Neopestalotiopsis sp. 37M]|nr:hypothetical protein E8E14_010894 [Neopestalotiopsis sp. 37M]
MDNMGQPGTSSSFSTVVYSRKRSSRACNATGGFKWPTYSEDQPATPAPSGRQVLNLLIEILESSGIYGPVITFGPPTHIGQGAQFVVTKQTMAFSEQTGAAIIAVAVKQPKFNLDSHEPLDLGHVQTDKHLRSLHTEFAALSNGELRQNPNITQMISWTFGQVGMHSPISVVMELADSTLRQYLQEVNDVSTFNERHDFCIDIATGLDAIHENGFIHGDLKPDNILIFKHPHRPVAKIADFGYCITKSTEQMKTGERMGGTEGWQAPEVEQHRLLNYTDMIKADNFSFGLLVWSIIAENGNEPPGFVRNQESAKIKEKLEHRHIDDQIVVFLCSVLHSLLHHEPSSRPDKLKDLFPLRYDTRIYDAASLKLYFKSAMFYSYVLQENGSIQRPFPSDEEIYEARLPVYSWEIQGLSIEFLQGLCDSRSRVFGDADSTTLFAAFLLQTTEPDHSLGLEYSPVRLLSAAAEHFAGKGPSLNARAVLPSALNFYGAEVSQTVLWHMRDWTMDAIADGSTWAKHDLEIAPKVVARAMERFWQQRDGLGPLLIAASSEDWVAIDILSSWGADVMEKDEREHSPFYGSNILAISLRFNAWRDKRDLAISECRIRSSRQPSSVPAYKTVPDYDDVARATAGKVTYLEMFITALTDSGLPGPITIMTMEEYLGQGAQFWVQRARMAYFEEGRHYHEAVALKVPKFDLDPLTPLQLGGNETERQLRDVWLEVKALSTPKEGDGDLVGTLFNVASEGSTVARASLSDFIDFYGIQAPAEICRHLKDWLEYAIEHGSILARHALQEVDPSALATSLQIFRSEGGYSELYWTMEGGISTIHEIACHGTLAELRSFLATTGNDVIHETTDSEETPLYLACARGAWDIADELLKRGASAAGFCTDFGISCLHWAFAFDGDVVHVAIKKLIQAGANINQLAYYEVPFMHFPFVLPAGTALHWAVVTSSSCAISALIDQGADWSIRDGSDPYKYDRRIRGVTSLRNDSEAYFEPFGETAGLSPLDYSAMHYDSYLFDLLVLKDNVDINSADEEGLTALHRLTDLQVWRTRTQVAYSALPFKGGRPQIRQKIRRCIQAMIALGADLEKPTCLQKSPVGPPDRTPLVLAVLAGLPDVVTALLNAGACINRLDSSGVTALHYNSDNLGINAGIARILLSRGANINNTSGILGPLEHARGDLDQIELLLSYGADIEERYVSGRPPKVGVLGLLAIQPIPPSETRDVRLASIMEKYLFNESGRVKRHSILEHDPRGETLLYRFAEQGHLRLLEEAVAKQKRTELDEACRSEDDKDVM